MEPRPFSRGNEYTRPLRARLKACFNGAAAFQPRKLRSMLDMSTVANGFNGAAAFQPRKPVGYARHAAYPGRASMEPRPFSRGNLARTRADAELHSASMEPRPFSRGNVMRNSRCLKRFSSLQWSRGLSAAETASYS